MLSAVPKDHKWMTPKPSTKVTDNLLLPGSVRTPDFKPVASFLSASWSFCLPVGVPVVPSCAMIDSQGEA